jgi:endonuclease/exonuclease/phosphatase family metal-dependent hydrolase
MVRWVQLEVNGTKFELAGIHLARPFYPELQQEDVAALIAFATSRTLPLVVAGDFNMSPWTEKLGRFERSSGLKRYNTFHLTWPMQKRSLPLVPLVAIDNVFASPRFARIAVVPGPRLGSDHRPITADLALQSGVDE